MLKKEHLELLNRQIEIETYASHLYLSMSLWCRYKGLDGCARFLNKQAEQELVHRAKLINYIIQTGGLPVLGQVPAPPSSYTSIKNIFEATLAHERDITKKINVLVDNFLQDKDYSTFSFLQWYVSEQHEEEHLISSILDRIDMIGEDDKRGMFWIDQEVGKMVERIVS